MGKNSTIVPNSKPPASYIKTSDPQQNTTNTTKHDQPACVNHIHHHLSFCVVIASRHTNAALVREPQAVCHDVPRQARHGGLS